MVRLKSKVNPTLYYGKVGDIVYDYSDIRVGDIWGIFNQSIEFLVVKVNGNPYALFKNDKLSPLKDTMTLAMSVGLSIVCDHTHLKQAFLDKFYFDVLMECDVEIPKYPDNFEGSIEMNDKATSFINNFISDSIYYFEINRKDEKYGDSIRGLVENYQIQISDFKYDYEIQITEKPIVCKVEKRASPF